MDPQPPVSKTIPEAVRIVRSGGLVLYPSDTVFGLGCDPFNEAALERLFRLKGRSREKGVLLLVPNVGAVEELTAIESSRDRSILESLWPGPVTCLLRGRARLPRLLVGAQGKVGVRCPDMPFLLEWLRALGGPLVSTSANRSGEPAPRSLTDLKRMFLSEVDLFIEGGPESLAAEPSTVVDLTSDPPRIVREGGNALQVALSLERLVRSSRGGDRGE